MRSYRRSEVQTFRGESREGSWRRRREASERADFVIPGRVEDANPESRGSGFALTARPGTTVSPLPVNSREKPNNPRILALYPYIDDRLAAASDSPKITHALH